MHVCVLTSRRDVYAGAALLVHIMQAEEEGLGLGLGASSTQEWGEGGAAAGDGEKCWSKAIRMSTEC